MKIWQRQVKCWIVPKQKKTSCLELELGEEGALRLSQGRWQNQQKGGKAQTGARPDGMGMTAKLDSSKVEEIPGGTA